MKKLIMLLMCILVVNVFSQTLTTHYEVTLRSSVTGNLVTSKDVDLYQSGVKKYDLSESSTISGVYYNDAVLAGLYDIYVDGIIWKANVWIGSNKVSIVVDNFNNSGFLKGAAVDAAADSLADGIYLINNGGRLSIMDSAITKEKLNSDVAGGGLKQDTDGSITIGTNLYPLENEGYRLYLDNPMASLTSGEKKAIEMIKDIRIFNADPSKKYNITFLCNDDSTYNYKVRIINNVDSTILLYSDISNYVNDADGLDSVIIPLNDNSKFEMIIDWSLYPNSVVFNAGNAGHLTISSSRYVNNDYRILKNIPNLSTVQTDTIDYVWPFWNYSYDISKIEVEKGTSYPKVIIKDSNILLRAKFTDGTIPYFKIAPGTYQFTGNYKIFGINLDTTGPTLLSNVSLIEMNNQVINNDSFIPLFYFWNGNYTSSVTFDSKIDYLRQRSYPFPLTNEPQKIDYNQIITPQSFYENNFHTSLNITGSLHNSLTGFEGKIYELTSSSTSNYWYLFADGKCPVDTTEDLYIEFDYKVSGGDWLMHWWHNGTPGWNPTQLIETLSDTNITRIKLVIKVDDLASDIYGEINNYFSTSVSGAKLYVGNFKVWNGDRGVELLSENQLTSGNAVAFNTMNLDSSMVANVFSNETIFSNIEKRMINDNLRISCVGSSVTCGGGFLQSSMVWDLIKRMQSEKTVLIDSNDIAITNSIGTSYLNTTDDRKYFDNWAVKITGEDAQIEFNIYSDEISFAQGIERSDTSASEIEMYVDDVLYDTFNNYNTTNIGIDTVTFAGDGTTTKFDLGMAFTYNHHISVDGVSYPGSLNTQDSGASIPTGDSCMIIRKYGNDGEGNAEVHHWVLFSTAPALGTADTIIFNYGEGICYEKTTIGKTNSGTLESAYGEGDVSFDPLYPTNLSSVLDFRETDSRAIKSYKFDSYAYRNVKLKIKGNYANKIGTPYFIFDFATSRMLYFQNAGIGGWKSSLFLSDTGLRDWKHIVDFEPNVMIYESTPNDDWDVKGYKLSHKYESLTLAELQSMKIYPSDTLLYNAVDDYDLNMRIGKIDSIWADSVMIDTSFTRIDIPPDTDDIVMLGTFKSNNKEYVCREIKSYNSTRHTITFDSPINNRDLIFTIDNLAGMEMRIRDLSVYWNYTKSLIDTIKQKRKDLKVALIPNPLPSIYSRDLGYYPYYINKLARNLNAYSINIDDFYEWQNTQYRDATVNITGADLTTDALTGYYIYDFGQYGQYEQNFSVKVNGIEKYGTDAFVCIGRGWSVDSTLSGNSLEFSFDNVGRSNFVEKQQQNRLEFVSNVPASGDNISITYSPNTRWSVDAAHVSRWSGSGGVLYGNLYLDYVMRSLSGNIIWDKLNYINPSTGTLNDLLQELIDKGYMAK